MRIMNGTLFLCAFAQSLLLGQVLKIPVTPNMDYQVTVSGAIFVNTDPSGSDPMVGVTMFGTDNREDGTSYIQKTMYGTPSPYKSSPDTVNFRNTGDHLYFFVVGEDSSAFGTSAYNGSYQVSVNGTTYELTKDNIIWANYFSSRGLVAYYPFNGNANDESGNGHDGTVVGGTLSLDRFGRTNSAYSFNGSSDYIKTPADNMLDGLHAGTVSFWFFSSAPMSDGTMIAYSTDGSVFSLYDFRLNQQKLMAIYKFPSAGYNPDIVGSTTLASGQWYHVAFVADGTSLLKIYLNGQLENVVLEQNGTNANGSEWFADITGVTSYNHFVSIGALRRNSAAENFFSGRIDDVRFYDHALSSTEVQALYHEGPTGVGRGSGSDLATPKEYILANAYPNPCNPSTTIEYTLPHRSHVTLTIFDMLGKRVEELINSEIEAGYHKITFNASSLASGVYFYRLRAGDFVQTRKLVLLR